MGTLQSSDRAGGIVRANARIVDRLLRETGRAEALPGMAQPFLDAYRLLAASLYESGTGVIVFGRRAGESELGIIHANGAAVAHLCANGYEGDVPTFFSVRDVERSLGMEGAVAALLESGAGWREWPPLGQRRLGSKTVTLAARPIAAEGYESAAALYLYDGTEWKQREEDLEDFLSITTHELRTPLVAISGSVKLIEHYFGGEYPDPSVGQFLGEISASSARLISMVNDFLAMARLEQGTLDGVPADMDVGALATETAKGLRTLADERGLLLTVQAAGMMAYADPALTKQILVNLIGNALKCTDAGGVTVSFERGPTGVVIRIADTGRGIAASDQSKLFKKFSQVRVGGDTSTGLGAGRSSGLGLYICRLLAERMGGKVWLERSEPGSGSVFALELPSAG